MRRPLRALGTGAAGIALVGGLAACSGDDGGGDSTDDLERGWRPRGLPWTTRRASPCGSVTDSLPDGVDGLVAADGSGNHEPAFEGTVTVVTGAIGEIDADVVAVDGDVYAKLPFTPGFAPIDPANYGAPDPAALMSADDGVSQWLTSAEDLSDEGESRDGEEVLAAVAGTLAGDVVAELIPSADESADFDVEFRLTDDDDLRDATITGPFYPGGDDVTYDLTVEPSDEDLEISAP